MKKKGSTQVSARPAKEAVTRWAVSGVVLALFWGALLYEYWPELASSVMRLFNSARSAGAETVESRYFEVLNSSNASPRQLRAVVQELEGQYEAVTGYLDVAPTEPIPVLVVNGKGPGLPDGAQILINYDNGRMDTTLTPLMMVLLVEEIPINPAGGIAPAGGHALEVVEAAGLGDHLIRQPLDAWVTLLRQENGYIPLQEAWKVGVPNDEESLFYLIRALLESGSFMRWFSTSYGIDSSMRVAHGEPIESVSGQPLAELERAWLKSLDGQEIEPKSCEVVIPRASIFSIMCGKIRELPK